MTDFLTSDSSVRMGRPPMNVKPTVVRLTQEALDRIEKVAGPNQRAAFIREAVDSELDRREGQSENPVQNAANVRKSRSKG